MQSVPKRLRTAIGNKHITQTVYGIPTHFDTVFFYLSISIQYLCASTSAVTRVVRMMNMAQFKYIHVDLFVVARRIYIYNSLHTPLTICAEYANWWQLTISWHTEFDNLLDVSSFHILKGSSLIDIKDASVIDTQRLRNTREIRMRSVTLAILLLLKQKKKIVAKFPN